MLVAAFKKKPMQKEPLMPKVTEYLKGRGRLFSVILALCGGLLWLGLPFLIPQKKGEKR